MTERTKAQLIVLVAILIVGGMGVAAVYYPDAKRVADILDVGFDVALAILIVTILAGSWYYRRKFPNAPQPPPRRKNPHAKQLLAGFAIMSVGFAVLMACGAFAFRDGSWWYLGGGFVAFGISLALALPRIQRFARHEAEEIARQLSDRA